MAGGNGGTIITSLDGVTWTTRASGTTTTLRAITYAPGKFVAVGNAGGIHVKFSASDTLRFAAPVTQEIEVGNLCIFGEAGKEGIRVLCESISQGTNDDGTLSLVEYAEEIYQADSGSIPAWDPKITIPRSSSHEPAYPVIEMVSDLGRKEARTAASTPTYQELADGYNFQGGDTGATPKGTTTPTDVTLEAEGVFRGIVLRWDRQVNLTNLDRYEVQVSDDSGSTWYSLKFDGTAYKDTLNQWTAWPSETLVHAGISPTGTDAAPTGRTLKYRVRRVTRANVASSAAATSAQAEATTSLVETGDVAANAITANNIDTGVLNAMLARIRDTVSIGEHGFTSVNNKRAIVSPQEDDRRMYLDRDEVHLEQYNYRHLYIALGLRGTILTSPNGINWTARASGTLELLYGITYGAGKFVAGGGNGVILTSPDGVTWTLRTSGTVNHLYGMVYAAGQFVATGQSGAILTSPDGVTWTARTSGTTAFLRAITYAAGQFVAGGDGGEIVTSPDGINWTTRTSGTTAILQAITYAAGKFVAVGSNGAILTSPDGVTWTARTSGTASPLYGMVYGSGQFVVVGYNDVVLTSPDGSTWTLRSSGTPQYLVDITYGAGQFVALGESGMIVTSPDGVTWTERISETREILYGIIHGVISREWDSVIHLGGQRDELALYREGKRTFSLRGNPAAEGALVEGRVDFQDPIHAKKEFSVSNGEWEFNVRPISDGGTSALELSIMKGGGMQMRSEIRNGVMNLVLAGALIAHGGCKMPAGVEWDKRPLPSGANQLLFPISDIAYGAGLFVAVGGGGANEAQILTSPDGVNWTRRTPEGVDPYTAITYAAGQFVAAQGTGHVLTSPDGLKWAQRHSGTVLRIADITYGAGLFVAVGSLVATPNAQILTSPDGITWTKRTSGAREPLYAVTYGAGKFVAGGGAGEVLTSPDGITWTKRTSGTREPFYAVTYAVGIFVAAGRNGEIRTSPDGVTWIRRTSGTREFLHAVTHGARKFVAGGGRVILTSTDTDIWEQRNKP